MNMNKELFEQAIKEAEELSRTILSREDEALDDSLVQDYAQRHKYLKGIRVDRAWMKFMLRANRGLILKASSVAAAVVIAFFTLFEFSDNAQEQIAANIYPAEGTVTIKLPSGETVALEQSQNQQGKLEGANLDVEGKEISYLAKGNEAVSSGNRPKKGGIDELQYHELIIPKGKSFSLVLSDGTKVWVNAESSIRYPVEFASNQREVIVEGEAFFDVVKDKSRPFIVKTADYSIRVLGTKFNVKSYKDENVVATTLVSGSISIPSGFAEEKVIAPGEQFRFNREDKTVAIERVDTELYTSWINSSIKLNGTPLNEIVLQLKRRYDVQFVFEDEDLKDSTFTGVIPLNENLSVILNMFSKVSSVQFRVEDNVVIVSKKS